MLLLVLAAVPGLFKLRLRTDGHALVPPNDPAVLLDASIREQFRLRDPIVVLLLATDPDGIYKLETLTRVQRLSEALAAIDGIGPEHVISLATERRHRVYPGTLNFRPFLDPLPTTPELMRLVRSDVETAGILSGTLVSEDETATTILVGVPPEVDDRDALYRKIETIVEPYRTEQDRILVVGAPVAEALLGRHVLQDLGLLVPLCIGLIALIVWIGCRRGWGVVLALIEVGACLIWTFGVMGWLGVPVYLTTAVLPVILTTIGLADEIHIFWHYQRRLDEADDGPHPATVLRTLDEMVRPVVFTSLTTAVGLLSFLASPIVPVRSFGLFAALGVLFCMVWSLTVIPAALVLIDPARLRRPRRRVGSEWTARVVAPLIRRSRLTLGAVVVLSLAAGFGLRSLYVQDSWIDGFARGSPFRQATELVNSKLYGTHVLLVRLDFARAADDSAAGAVHAPLMTPDLLAAVGEFEAFLRSQPGVGGVLGPYSHLTAVHSLFMAGRKGERSLPRDPRRLGLVVDRFDTGRGEQRRREVIDDARRRGVVTVYLRNANYRDTALLMRAIGEYADERLAQFGAVIDFGGDVAVSQAMIAAVVRTQIASLLLALVSAFVALSLLVRSVRAAVLAILPAAVAVLWVLGALGWLGIPLGVATSMFCAITLGISVDYAIHFLEAVRRARRAGTGDAVGRAVAEAGPAIVVDTLAVALGFGLLLASQVPANARLGLLVGLALIAGSFLTLAGLGSLLMGTGISPPSGKHDVALGLEA